MRNFTWPVLIIVGFALLSGCGSDDNVGQVSGQVIYADRPVKMGMVSFEPDGRKSQSHGIPIRDGKYKSPTKIKMKPGNYLVRITAPNLSKTDLKSQPGPNGMVPDIVPLLPPSWNQQSELRVEIKPGQNEISFSGPKMSKPQVKMTN